VGRIRLAYEVVRHLHEHDILAIVVPKSYGRVGTRGTSADDGNILEEDVGQTGCGYTGRGHDRETEDRYG
jgi:hypothetical protein